MSRGLAAFLILGLVVLASPARAERLILALSSQMVKISSSFTGTGITVFGAIERDAATVSRGSVYDVVIVVRGPAETLVTRRKERFAGIWLNRASETFVDMPSFYSLLSSRSLDQVTTPQLRQRYQLGASDLAFRTPAGGPPSDPAFRDAFVRLKQKAGLYGEDPTGVSFPGDSVFQATVPIPANVPIGVYRVEAYLFRDSALLATANAAIGIAKTGFEQFTFDLARNAGFVYGFICVLLALLTGWLAGVLFRRD